MCTHYTKQYVGIRVDNGQYERFTSERTPVRETQGQLYSVVIGPFRTVRGVAQFGRGNPHVQHVNDAERLALKNSPPNY